ncbi:MAG: family 1 glycosylhydrolase, partial [Firmicutes bacterium]|nr:family 1 glycosylhydrolase [Bacillota bacterium]
QYAALTDAIVAPADPDLIRSDDMAVISRPIDFLGVNYYSYSVVAGDPAAITTAGVRDVTPHDEVTDMNWPVKAAGLSDLLQRIARDYTSIPLMVTENGAAYADRKIEDRVADADRVSYLRRHIEALAVALDAASSEFYRDGAYRLDGEGRSLSASELAEELAELCRR